MPELKPGRLTLSQKYWKSEWGMHLCVNLIFLDQETENVYIFPKGHPKIIKRGWTRELKEEISVDESDLEMIGDIEQIIKMDGLVTLCS